MFAQADHVIDPSTFGAYLLATIGSLVGVIVFFFKLVQSITSERIKQLEARANMAEQANKECNDDRNKIWRAIAAAGVNVEFFKSGSDEIEIKHEKH